jgi:hydrogenase-4 component E
MTPLALVIIVLGALVLVDTRAKRVLGVYVVLALVIAALTARSVVADPPALAAFVLAALLKIIGAPLGILWFLRRAPEADDLRASVSLPLRVLGVFLLVAASLRVETLPALAGLPMQGPVAFVTLCGLGLVLLHRNVLADLLGLLVLGAGITLEAVLAAPALPEAVELGAAFDVLVTTFIGLALLRTLRGRGMHLDVDALRSLRG